MNFEKKLLNIIDDIDDSIIDDVENMKVNLDDITLKKIKKNFIKNTHKKNKKHVFIAASLSLILGIGFVFSKPSLASNIPSLDYLYETLGYYKEYKDYNQYIGLSKSSNGFTYTIDKIVGTPNKVLLAVKIHNNHGFNKEYGDFIPRMNINGIVSESGEYSFYRLDDKNIICVIEADTSKSFPKRGQLNFNIHTTKGKDSNVNFKFKVNFNKCYKQTKDIKLKNIKFNNTNISKINTSILGTNITVKGGNFNNFLDNNWFLQLNNKLYKTYNASAHDDLCNIQFKLAEYNTFTKAKNINLLVFKSNLIKDENLSSVDKKFIEKTNNYIKNNKIEQSGIIYNQKFRFNDNSLGEFYKVERKNNKVKLYFKSNNDEATILNFLNSVWLQDFSANANNDDVAVRFYYGYIHKINNKEHCYIYEFNNVNNNQKLQVSVWPDTLIKSKYTKVNKIKIK